MVSGKEIWQVAGKDKYSVLYSEVAGEYGK